ncbi:MAG: cytochrome c oxidase subunit II [Thermoleophilaceae bacterium]|nr:cytochrome c oxidase subunit II [Thermoleophilaceae bacterium]
MVFTGRHHGLTLPAGLGDTGHQYAHLFDIYVPIALGVWVAITLAVGVALFRYRRRPGRAPSGRHTATRLEASYAVVLACTVAALLYLTFTTEDEVDALPRKPGLVVHVTGAMWNWRFDYPAYGISIVAGTVRPGTLYVPTRTEVLLELRSIDVVHSLWVPATRIKKDVFPGAEEELGLKFPRAGTFRGVCAEFCGTHHADMTFSVRALPPARFRQWAERNRGLRQGESA